MKERKIVSFAEFSEARKMKGSNGAAAVGKGQLPGAHDLWQLLDRNISIAVWRNEK